MSCFKTISISLYLSNIKSPLTIIALFMIIPLPFLCCQNCSDPFYQIDFYWQKCFEGWWSWVAEKEDWASWRKRPLTPLSLSIFHSFVEPPQSFASLPLCTWLVILFTPQPQTRNMSEKLLTQMSGPKTFFCVISIHQLAVKPFFIESEKAKQRFVITLLPRSYIKNANFLNSDCFHFWAYD